jgi:hypothetical protein
MPMASTRGCRYSRQQPAILQSSLIVRTKVRAAWRVVP